MIHAERLTKKFDDFLAVDQVDLKVLPGQVLVLLGPNGAGKTTTIRMLSSVLSPTSGSAIVAGFDVVNDAKKVRSQVGVLTEQHGLYRRMQAAEYLQFFAQVYQIPPSKYQPRIRFLLEQFGLDQDKKKRLGEYSKGMRQKLALVRALLHDPPVLLLDEPTSAMDPESARMVRDSIRSVRSGERTIILCTHNLFEAEELADQVAIIRSGRIIMNDTPENLKRNLLGPQEFVLEITGNLDSSVIYYPPGVTLLAQHGSRICFQSIYPEKDNPQLLRSVLDGGMDVISLQKVPQSLENAYISAIQNGRTSQG